MTNLSTETLFDETETANSKQIAILKKHFPQCFDKDGHFQPEKMMEVVKANEVDMVKESYSLNWLGKAYARLLTNLPPQKLLKPDTTHNESAENSDSGNILIKGDNLEVLKHLVNGYREKIKMIYIDPPYNTGSDGFVYQDNFKFSVDDLSRLAGIDKAEAERILSFNAKGSNSHSAWLTFMYPRLYIARELLKEDGVIFISIDDNEQAQLQLLCDEIFGEENFISDIAVVNNPKGRSDQINIATAHESLLVYAKSTKLQLRGFEAGEHITKRYNKEDDKGRWREIDLRKTGSNDRAIDRPNMYYPFYWDEESEVLSFKKTEGSVEIYPMKSKSEEGCWRWAKDNAEKNMELLYARYMPVKKQWSVFEKDYLDTEELIKSTSVWSFKDVNSERGTDAFVKELGFSRGVFKSPKPVGTIHRATQLGADKDSIILDFFSGSGTTAQSIMQLNADDKGSRKFVCVQLDEATYDMDTKTGEKIAKKGSEEAFQAGYMTIFEITKERIRRSAEKIARENEEYQGDLGFKVYETTNDFRPKIDDDLAVANESLFDDMVLSDEQYQALLTTWMLYDNNVLTADIISVDLQGYNAELINKNLYLIASDFGTQNLKCLLDKLDEDKSFAPDRIIVNGYNFDTAIQMELNEAIKSYQNKKKITINIIVRY
ncbi:site-specific DNA-methyltransferase [Moraxella osloensis]|uniref:site-specific DNA-methyltransferase (adenine-specific) n=1 Tax=Faucicola osloensis TaxID=34062 RepID=A0AAW6TI41_FAUOS|nr:site-specific DNA-methyltransferase [Moraxella osloensis]MDI4510285.1 site-specific DNA-methyltransferase [Moraxella osloensis]